jgi:hypothetical protein
MGDRLKTPGRGWREDHLDPTATLINLVQTTEWPDLCKPSANLTAGFKRYTRVWV